MKRTKLLLVASSFFPTHGGAELRFLRYLPLLKDHGIEVEVITGTPKLKKFSEQDHVADWRKAKDGELVSVQKIEFAQIFQYKLPEVGSVKRSQLLLDQVIVRCENDQVKPDVIQLLIPLSIKTISRLKRIKATSTPVVFSYALAHTFSKNFAIANLQKWRIRRVYKYFDCVITASSVLKDLVCGVAPETCVEVIPNGVDINKFKPINDQSEKQSLRIKLNLPEDAIIISLIGAIHPRKGTDLLISAWSDQANKNLHLLLIGPRFDLIRSELCEFKKKIKDLIEESGFPGNVRFTGAVENIADYLKASDMFVFPSKKEGMPNAVLEAMATGLPTVLTPFVGLSEDFGEAGKEYLLTNRSSDAISSAIKSILKDDRSRIALGSNARNWVVNTMQLEKSVRLYANVYSSLAHQVTSSSAN